MRRYIYQRDGDDGAAALTDKGTKRGSHRHPCVAPAWVTAAPHGAAPAPSLPSLEKWPAPCKSAERVCFHDGELVALPAASSSGGKSDSFYEVSLPDTSPLHWFGEARVAYNLPGYYDGVDGVQRTTKPITVRPLARSLESRDLASAPVLANITPVIVFPNWPENFGETMGESFMYLWVSFLAAQPEVRQMPVAVAMPHNLNLPGYWRLLEAAGVRIEDFGAISAGCPMQPLCFARVIGCRMSAHKEWWAYTATDEGRAWEKFRQDVVAHNCHDDGGGDAGHQQLQNKDPPPLRVAFVHRHNRHVRNVQELLGECRRAGAAVGGRAIRCDEVSFGDVRRDVCALQGIDVLVGMHGADMVNGIFMRPGRSVIEVRAATWYDTDDKGRIKDPSHWSNSVAQKFWLTNHTQYWWYGAPEEDSFPETRSKSPGRDANATVSWSRLTCMLQRITSGDEAHDSADGDVAVGGSIFGQEHAELEEGHQELKKEEGWSWKKLQRWELRLMKNAGCA